MKRRLFIALILTSEISKADTFAFVTPPASKVATKVKQLQSRGVLRYKTAPSVAPLSYKQSTSTTETDGFPSIKFNGDKLLVDRNSSSETKHKHKASTKESKTPQVILPTPQPYPGDCNVKDYILSHATYYTGDESFLSNPTPRTLSALSKFNELLTLERQNGGVLSVDTEVPSTITSHAPGYLLDKERDVIVGLQAEEPLRRTCKPRGGFGVVNKALEAYGYEPGERLRFYETDVTTHNDLTFSIYTDEVRTLSLVLG
jgi:hypothetical protein